MKTCNICGKSEPEVEFYKGYTSKCKKCRNKEDAQNRAEKAGKIYIPKSDVIIPEGFKICSKCKKVLPLSDFYVLSAKKKDGSNKIYSRCKECERAIVLEHPNRDEYIKTSNQNSANRRQEDPEYNSHLNQLNKNYYGRETGMITHMLYAAKVRATNNNLEFNLEREDIIIPTHCPILGTEFIKGDKEDYTMTYSLDRVDNSQGYIKGNVRVISMLANSMKNAATPEQLKAFSENILKYIN